MTKQGQHAGKSAKGKTREAPAVEEILHNRKLHHDYAVLDTWEAGMQLMGSEVKSLRARDVQWADAHARIDQNGECWLWGLHIGEFKHATAFGHTAQRPRRLLLNRKEIDKIAGKLKGKGLTLIPQALLFRRGFAKIVICLCQGKTKEDKRSDLVKRATDRDVQREMARRAKRG